MTCECCGRWSPADRETGYRADRFCPSCQMDEDDARASDAADAEYDQCDEDDRARDEDDRARDEDDRAAWLRGE